MFLGHYAVALGGKKLAPEASLGTLLAAGAFLDLVWPVLVLAGLERVEIAPGATAFTPLDFVSYPYSHSLLAAALWGLLFGAAYFIVRRYRLGAIVIGLLVVSHWALDAIAHRPDLPLFPWDSPRIGFSLWNSVPGTCVVEFALLAAGAWLYLTATSPRDRIGRWGPAGFLLLVFVIFLGAAFGPPPPNVTAVALSGLSQWIIVLLGAWIDRHRTPTRTATRASSSTRPV
jgi:hypothetical protein